MVRVVSQARYREKCNPAGSGEAMLEECVQDLAAAHGKLVEYRRLYCDSAIGEVRAVNCCREVSSIVESIRLVQESLEASLKE